MISTRLELYNYGPFRGRHVVDLQPSVYSVVARDEADPERSNWIGKSFFLSAFRFALIGKQPRRTEDEWITDGEPEGGVTLILEDDIEIVRTRRRGRSTQLRVKRGSEVAEQDRAQEIIYQLIGFDSKDFDGACWVRQKGANAIVVADPADRTRTVAGWMDMEPLQRAAEVEAKRLLEAVGGDRELADRIGRLNDLIESVGDPGELAARISEQETAIVEEERELERLHLQIEQAGKVERLARREAELERLIEDGTALKAAIKADQEAEEPAGVDRAEIEADQGTTEVAFSEARTEADRVGRLVVGEGFDGVCPVMKTACPAAEDVRERARTMSREYQQARDRLTALQGERGRLAVLKQQADREDRARAEKEKTRALNLGRLQAMRDRAVALQAEVEQLGVEVGEERPDGELARADASRLQSRIGIAKGEVAALGKQLGSVDGWTAQLEAAEGERAQLEARLRIHREAAVVLGRNGAQRRVAEGNLADIEAGANDLLGGAGIDLSIRARWGREGSGLAKHCQACGQPFPASAKVKECQTCGAPRGPHVVEKLELELSSSSDGAAEDVGGLAMQLSAAAWLRARRQAAWSAVFIDEPFAGTDAAVGRLLAGRLRVMLGGRYSFRQAFVISHSSALTDMMPSRIEIVKRLDGELRIETK